MINNKKERSITPGVLLAAIGGALLIGLLTAQSAVADRSIGAFEVIIVSDDIRKTVTATARPGDAGGAESAGDGGDDGSGNGNNGHGNNLDGVDSSNPGEGGGGPTGGVDPSGDYDDEGAGGGAAPRNN